MARWFVNVNESLNLLVVVCLLSLCSGRSLCKSKIECGPYMAFLSAWNSTKGERVITTTKCHQNGFAWKNVTEHPITLQSLFAEKRISMSVNYYVTREGHYLSANEGNYLSIIKPQSESDVAHFVSYCPVANPNDWAHVCFMCAVVANKTTKKKTSYLVAPFKPFHRLNGTSCESYENFRATAIALANGGRVDTENGPLKLKQEDYQFQHLHVAKVIKSTDSTASRYLSKKLRSLCS